MGNDGGSIPGRQDLVKELIKAKKEETEELVKLSKSQYCSISKEPLKPPLAVDRLGQLYNKQSIIQTLLQKTIIKGFNHITSIKDIKELKGDLSDNGRLRCPISMIEFSGMNQFSALWNCGCVISNNAINELGMKGECIVCGKVYDVKGRDLISLNYTNEEKAVIIKRIMEEKNMMKRLKKDKHKEKDKEDNGKLLNRKRRIAEGCKEKICHKKQKI